jgi:MraZ protein
VSFRGASVHTINDSGRVSIPSKIRETLKSVYGEETLTLVIGRSYIVAYPTGEWEKFERTLQENPATNEQEANLERFLYASLAETAVDRQGRILIPPALRLRAGLSGEVMIVGRLNRFEIWDKAKWDAVIGEGFPDSSAQLGAQFNQLSL